MLLSLLVDEIGATIEDDVSRVATQLEEERTILIAFDEFNGLQIKSGQLGIRLSQGDSSANRSIGLAAFEKRKARCSRHYQLT